jgi:hypothetical protein
MSLLWHPGLPYYYDLPWNYNAVLFIIFFGVPVQNMALACSCIVHNNENLAGNPPLPLRTADPHGTWHCCGIVCVDENSLPLSAASVPGLPNSCVCGAGSSLGGNPVRGRATQSSGRPDLLSILVGPGFAGHSLGPLGTCVHQRRRRRALGLAGDGISRSALSRRPMVWPGPESGERAPEAAVTVPVPR